MAFRTKQEIGREIARLRDMKRRLKTNCKCTVPQPVTMSCATRLETDCPACGTHNGYHH